MPQIVRKYTFQPKKKILSTQMNEELDQLIAAVNGINGVSRDDVVIKGDTTPYVPVLANDPATKAYVDQKASEAALGQIPDGSLPVQKLAFDPATQAELDVVKLKRIYKVVW